MVEQTADPDLVFGALAHAARRDMLARLAQGQATVGELAAPLAMSFAGASKHVRVLEKAGLVHRTVVGRTHVCRLVPGPLQDASRWLGAYERFWTDRLDDLAALFDPPAPPTPPKES